MNRPGSGAAVIASAPWEIGLACHHQGDLAGAEAQYRAQLAIDPRHAGALHLLGLVALQTGRAQEALQRISQSLQIDPAQVSAHLNHGVSLRQLGQLEPALASFERALQLDPDYAEALNNAGEVLLELQRPSEALPCLDRAIVLQADFAAAHHNRGNALACLGRLAEALQSFERTLALEPQFPRAMVNRGHALRGLGRMEQALSSFEQALALDQKSRPALYHRGTLLLEMGRFEAALQCFEQLLQLEPQEVATLTHHAVALLQTGRAQQALQSLDRALHLQPDLVLALIQRGHVHLLLQRPQKALADYERALQLRPDDADAVLHSGIALEKLHRFEEADARYEQALRLQPDYPFGRGLRLHSRLRGCNWDQLEAQRAATVEAVLSGTPTDTPFSFLSVSASGAAQLQCARALVADRYPASSVSCAGPAPYRHERIRIAYVSADLRNHAVSRLLIGVFEQHDRDRFETVAIALQPRDEGSFGRRVSAAFDRYIDCSALSDAQICAAMRELEIDIAVDLMGFTEGQRTRIFAQRAAPVQVNFLGFPGTMGAAYIDYLIADAFVIPPASRHLYAERVVYLPHCFQPNDDRRLLPAPLTRAELGLPEQGFIWCCHNSSFKLNEDMFDIWMHLLQQTPGSVLWLLASSSYCSANLCREARRRQVDPARLLFASKVPYEEHIARLSAADLFLDTLPFNAGTTASDALWAGLPLLTCSGEAFAARMAGSLLRTAGLDELVTFSLDAYQHTALELAHDAPRLARLRARLSRARSEAPLFQSQRYRRQLERAYQTMWQRAERHESPAAFEITEQD
jgi:predicted O-linked N-acetylglucosamine transferase (SPINDLY family)